MKTKKFLYIIVMLLAVCLGITTVGCGDDDVDGGDDLMIPAVNLDCENNWVREEGHNGRLYQAVEITFNVPEGYTGPAIPFTVGSAFTSNPAIPAMSMPELMGESDKTAELTAGEPYMYSGSFHNRASNVQDLVCGEYFHLAIQIFQEELSFPTGGEWIYMSDAQYQVGGDTIVVGTVDMVPNLTQ